MSRTVAFVSLASAEYADAVLWYEAAQPGLGAAFRAAVQRTLHLIAERPQSFALHPDTGLRRALLPRFPYSIHFEDTPERIVVFAVFHAKRDPRHLADRR